MNKMKTRLFAFAALALTLAACNNDNEDKTFCFRSAGIDTCRL